MVSEVSHNLVPDIIVSPEFMDLEPRLDENMNDNNRSSVDRPPLNSVYTLNHAKVFFFFFKENSLWVMTVS